MHHSIDRITHTTAFVTPVVEHWLDREIIYISVHTVTGNNLNDSSNGIDPRPMVPHGDECSIAICLVQRIVHMGDNSNVSFPLV